MRITYFFIGLLIAINFSCSTKEPFDRQVIDLSGNWQFRLDSLGIGISEEWYNQQDFGDTIYLPGTTDSNAKGFLNTDTTTLHLNREYIFEGQAWYQKEITVPQSFSSKHIELILERTKLTKVWVDGSLVGESTLLQSPQLYDMSTDLPPGKHTITIMVDNNLKRTPYGNVHIYSDDTQTNWNGIIGQLLLTATGKQCIANIKVYPDVLQRSFEVGLDIEVNEEDKFDLDFMLRLRKNGSSKTLKTKHFSGISDRQVTLSYSLGDEMDLWDEYEQPLYDLEVVLSRSGEVLDLKSTTFGMREFGTKDKQFTINGRKTFLRGKHDAAVFPQTGYTPMNKEEWLRVFEIARSYGINHYRFHTYCPPEAAFAAADELGIYLQAELPFWGGLESDTVQDMLETEGKALLKAYGNHPSFVMFSPGNEIWSGHDRVEELMVNLKSFDDRPLYAMGSNNNIGYLPPRTYCEFFVGARIPENGDSIIGHTRLTHAFADANDGGILNTSVPSTMNKFDYAVDHMDLPLISHEIGQYQIYPNYDEIEKYKGVLKPWNLNIFKKKLETSGMGHLDSLFQQASGRWSAICYKAEMEAALRTKDMAGFQLLDLQDFPGQGTALVGVLDAFMDSKGVISEEEWSMSCNDVTLLAEINKFCWNADEPFVAQIKVSNYSNKNFDGKVHWQIMNKNNEVITSGELGETLISSEGLTALGTINASVGDINEAKKYHLKLSLPGTAYQNSYPIWFFPNQDLPNDIGNIAISNKLNAQTISDLRNGSKVLYFPDDADVSGKSYKGHFPPEFWNYEMFKSISEHVKRPVSPGTLGILTKPNHPIFKSFPTDFHTNWQWYSIIKASNSLILDELDQDYFPIVQVIDNLQRNHKLGMIFEFKVGQGKLLVCMSQLNTLQTIEGKTLYQSILNYMNSDDFDPNDGITESKLKSLFN